LPVLQRWRPVAPTADALRSYSGIYIGDDVELIFDGAGTQWVPELEDEDSDYHDLYQTVRDDAAACEFCSGAFGVEDAVSDSGVVTLDDHDGHPSVRSLVDDDYEIITF
jgi:hypothetical protein